MNRAAVVAAALVMTLMASVQGANAQPAGWPEEDLTLTAPNGWSGPSEYTLLADNWELVAGEWRISQIDGPYGAELLVGTASVANPIIFLDLYDDDWNNGVSYQYESTDWPVAATPDTIDAWGTASGWGHETLNFPVPEPGTATLLALGAMLLLPSRSSRSSRSEASPQPFLGCSPSVSPSSPH